MTGTFRSRLRQGEMLLGTMVTIPSATCSEILAELGYDWLFIDGEHGPLETGSILSILQAVGHRIACVVRVPGTDEGIIKKTLDIGVEGLIVPMVNTPEQAADVVRFSRYTPVGLRGVGLYAAQGYGLRFQEYLSGANEQVAVIVQAEHIARSRTSRRSSRSLGSTRSCWAIRPLRQHGPHGKDRRPGGGRGNRPCNQGLQGGWHAARLFRRERGSRTPVSRRGYNLIAAGVDTLIFVNAARSLLDDLRR
ncbi:MAG: aldolase/citrate lyase family protein [Isosphaeraceae bacterium]